MFFATDCICSYIINIFFSSSFIFSSPSKSVDEISSQESINHCRLFIRLTLIPFLSSSTPYSRSLRHWSAIFPDSQALVANLYSHLKLFWDDNFHLFEFSRVLPENTTILIFTHQISINILIVKSFSTQRFTLLVTSCFLSIYKINAHWNLNVYLLNYCNIYQFA